MKTKLLILLLTVSVNFYGQIGFDENIVVGNSYTTMSPQFVKAADVDGDHDLDIITFGAGLNWYENVDGLGNFGEKKTIAVTYGASALYTVDFDNDGDLDILGSVFNKFTLYKNTDGLGNFEVMQVFPLGTEALISVPSDIDNDGNIDILCFYNINTTTPSKPKLVWFKNDGSGKFGQEQFITDSYNNLITASLLVTEDLDGDSDQDIIIGYKDYSKITWLKNTDGKGTFSTPQTITILAGGLSSITTSDIDHDGDKDIISASANDKQVAWYKNLDGLGNFSDENIIASNANETNAVLVTDINNDNTVDIVYTSKNEIGWMSNTTGLGDFGNQQIITNKAFGVRSVITADIDGDGKNDIISASQDDNKVAWYKHIDGNGNFGRQVVIARIIQDPSNVYPGDFDGDNDIDLLVNSKDDAKLTWFENVNGLGFYGKQHIITESVSVGNITPQAYPVDIDGDGDLDIATVQHSVLFWYENIDGQGNFTTEHVIDSNSSATIIRSKDIDGDGDMDLVCGVYNADKISWYKNLDSNGTFGSEQIITDTGDDNGSLTSLEIADMDGDKDMDIIASSYNTDTYYYKNTNGLGDFVEEHMDVFNAMQAVYPADVDGDGDNDIIGVSASGGGPFDSVVWYENSNGKGDFSNIKHDISTLTTNGESIHAADIDNDGDIDVLTASGHSQTSGIIAWYQNNGNGTFYERQIIQELFNYNIGVCVNTADVDNDNDLDVLAVFGYGSSIGRVSVLENLGPLSYTIQGKVLIDTDSNGCTISDVKASNLMVISDNGNNSFATFTDQNGAYHIATTEGNFTTSITSQLPDYFASNPTSHAFSFSGTNNTYLADFCITPIGEINDLNVSLYPSLNDVRPGFGTYYRIVYRNIGTTTSSGTVKFEYNNNKLSFLTATENVSSQTANTLTFDFANLKPFETKTIDLNFTVFATPITNINDEVISSVTVIPTSGDDQTEKDNSFTLNQTVIGSYDPNYITCLEGKQVLIEDSDEFLHYIIRFQNTGNASAINVNVENILDNKLDWTSMQLESLSHSGKVEIKDGKQIKFIFDKINLPDNTTDEPNSHGFIAYKIKPLNNVVAGDIIKNTADIYFDFNPRIVTNTASTRFTGTLSVVESDVNQYNIYPSPTTGLLNIQANTMIEKVSVIDVNGRLVKEFQFNTPVLSTQLDLTHLAKGIYFLKIKSNQGNTNRKIIKR
ncbi:MAG TPA: T9SS type A sorting domain-containing protein [Flavobacterium sp.]|uniref:T9SS type A sorting domain-containing protein n=1 Tax=Flavobacterium sp. TaxID=239 RepID=UPI002DB590FB|nr:T9SS type A sorting domain-containing protein [Flavobacterium sp.]HEU4789286.1 T9SS type A sorting domain-containing protein [Flavobacterium sp.]